MRVEQTKNITVSDGGETPEARFAEAIQNASNGKTVNTGNFHVSVTATPGSQNQKVDDKTRAAVEATGDKAAVAALDDPNLADISNTGPALSDISTVDKVSDNVYKVTTKDGKEATVVKQVTPYLFDSVVGHADAANAIRKSEGDGYKLAQKGDTAPGLRDYKSVGSGDEVGPGLIRYETQSGQKVIVSKEANPDLYDKVKADHDTWGVINQSETDGYRLAGPNEKGDMKAVGTPEELGNGLIRYETSTGEKIIVSKDITPDLYDQTSKLSGGLNGKPGASVGLHLIVRFRLNTFNRLARHLI